MKPKTPEEALHQLTALTQENTSLLEHVTNLKEEGRALVRMTTLCSAPPTVFREAFVSNPFCMVAFYAHAVPMQSDATGEEVRQVRIVLLDADNNTLAFVSGGVLNSLSQIIAGCGVGPWHDDPLYVTVSSTKTGKGRSILRLNLEDTPTKPKGKSSK